MPKDLGVKQVATFNGKVGALCLSGLLMACAPLEYGSTASNNGGRVPSESAMAKSTVKVVALTSAPSNCIIKGFTPDGQLDACGPKTGSLLTCTGVVLQDSRLSPRPFVITAAKCVPQTAGEHAARNPKRFMAFNNINLRPLLFSRVVVHPGYAQESSATKNDDIAVLLIDPGSNPDSQVRSGYEPAAIAWDVSLPNLDGPNSEALARDLHSFDRAGGRTAIALPLEALERHPILYVAGYGTDIWEQVELPQGNGGTRRQELVGTASGGLRAVKQVGAAFLLAGKTLITYPHATTPGEGTAKGDAGSPAYLSEEQIPTGSTGARALGGPLTVGAGALPDGNFRVLSILKGTIARASAGAGAPPAIHATLSAYADWLRASIR